VEDDNSERRFSSDNLCGKKIQGIWNNPGLKSVAMRDGVSESYPQEGIMRTKISFALSMILLSLPVLAASGPASLALTKFNVVPLVSDQPGVAANTDPDLVNAWGISHAPGGPNWVSDNGTDKATIYDRNTGAKQPPVVRIPHGAPTGNVFVPPRTGFNITANGKSGPAIFLFDTESGAIEGWNFDVDLHKAIIAVDSSSRGSVYKGLALDPTDKLLFAADFVNNQVQVFNNAFGLVRVFTDSGLPARFAPFNVAWIRNLVYVAFAKREKTGFDELHGIGLGYVDVFDINGNLLQRLIQQGKLNAPWGMAIAPTGFGPFAGNLLVGNFGDGRIHAYDAATGAFKGTLRGNDGTALTIDGLWALEAGPNSNVTFTSGPYDESRGLIGLIPPPSAAVAAR